MLVILTLLLLNISCQNKNSFTTLEYKVLDVNQDNESFMRFVNSHTLSMWYMHNCRQTINDTLFYIVLSQQADELFVYNKESYQTKVISLNKIPKYRIDYIYYHNHDSIFIFFDRWKIFKETNNEFDFILLNGNGDIINTYSLNNIPNIYKGFYNNTILYNLDRIAENRIIDGNLIITFTIYSPGVENPDFINFHPRQLCLYNLSNKTFKMLNIKYPIEDIGKRYDKNGYPSTYSLCYDRDKNIIINFSHSNKFYRYNFAMDSLVPIKCKYDYTFENIDSTARKKGHEYISIMFAKPYWDSKNCLFLRTISILSYKDYIEDRILQVLDSNFNHIAYVLNNSKYRTPFLDNSLIAYNRNDELPYNIQLESKIKKISWKEFESNHLEKKQKTEGRKITFDEYITKLQIPEKSLVLIINLNYPCGHCLEYLFSKMKENRAEYEKSNIYYIIFDKNSEKFSETLIKRYGLINCKSIKTDNSLLESVVFFGQPVSDNKYRVIEYKCEYNVIKVQSCSFEELTPLFERKVNEKLMK